MKTVFISPKNSLQEVFDGLEPDTTVVFEAGIYRQKAVLAVSDVTLLGHGDVKICYDDFAKKPDESGYEKQLTTFKSLCITSNKKKFVHNSEQPTDAYLRNTWQTYSSAGQRLQELLTSTT